MLEELLLVIGLRGSDELSLVVFPATDYAVASADH